MSNANIATNAVAQANNFNFFIGDSTEEQIQNLQELRDAMVDVYFQTAELGGQIKEGTTVYIMAIYAAAESQLQALKDQPVIN